MFSYMSLTLFWYTALHVATRVICTLLAITAIFNIIGIAEAFQNIGGKQNVSAWTIITLEAIKLPSTIPELIPFSFLIGSMISFHKLRMSNEIIAARTSGMSLNKIILPAIAFSLVFGIFALLVIDPIASATRSRYEALDRKVFGSNSRNLSVSTEGIWFRDQSLIIHGDSIGEDAFITKPIVYRFDETQTLIVRYHPEKLKISEGYWHLEGGVRIAQDSSIAPIYGEKIAATLSENDLRNSIQKPQTIPFLELNGYINVLDRAGLSTLGHSSYYYAKMVSPLLLASMVLIAACFTLPFGNQSKISRTILAGILTTFLFYIVNDFLYIMGSSAKLPPIVAGSASTLIMLCLGLALFMRADDLPPNQKTSE